MAGFFHTTMPIDIDKPKEAPAANAVLPAFACDLCSHAFNSSKALGTHKRTAHKMPTPLRLFCDANGVCPVCRVAFGSRIRLLNHVSETRCRGKTKITCRDMLLTGDYPRISQARCDELDLFDREQRASAKRAGRSQPLVAVPARRSKQRAVPDNSVVIPVVRLKRKSSPLEILQLNKRRRMVS